MKTHRTQRGQREGERVIAFGKFLALGPTGKEMAEVITATLLPRRSASHRVMIFHFHFQHSSFLNMQSLTPVLSEVNHVLISIDKRGAIMI